MIDPDGDLMPAMRLTITIHLNSFCPIHKNLFDVPSH
jgi:hypothetical protein